MAHRVWVVLTNGKVKRWKQTKHGEKFTTPFGTHCAPKWYRQYLRRKRRRAYKQNPEGYYEVRDGRWYW